MRNEQDNSKIGQPVTESQSDTSPLMAVYNAQPPQPEQPARFYWQEPWRDAAGLAADDAVQAAFEN